MNIQKHSQGLGIPAWNGVLEEQSDSEEPTPHRLRGAVLRARGPPSGSGQPGGDAMSDSGDTSAKQTHKLSDKGN